MAVKVVFRLTNLAKRHYAAVQSQGYPFEGDLSDDLDSVWLGGKEGRWYTFEEANSTVWNVQPEKTI